MRRPRGVEAALAAMVALAAPLPVAAQSGADTPQYITYTEEVPCPPTKASAPSRHAVVRRRRLHHVAVRKRAPAIAKKQVAVVHAPVRPHRVVRVRHVVRKPRVIPANKLLVRASDPAQSKRCTVVRRDRLTAASFGITPETVVLTPIRDEVQPQLVPQTRLPLSSGRAAFGDPINPSTGGGSIVTDASIPPIASALPEPSSWALLFGGVGIAGFALRRRRGGRLAED